MSCGAPSHELNKRREYNRSPAGKEAQRTWRKRNPEKAKAIALRNNLNRDGEVVLSFEEALNLISRRGEPCEICGKPSEHVDHKGAHIRGLLCQKCNRGLGHFNDDPKLLQAAIKYIDEEEEV